MLQSLLKIIKLEQFSVHLDVLAPHWSEGLLKRMPEVRYLICHSLKHGQWAFKERFQLAQALRVQDYQQAIVLPNSWKAALIPWWANIPQRTGYLGELRYGLLNDIRKLDTVMWPKTVEQFAALGLPQGKFCRRIPNPRLSPGPVDIALQRLGLQRPSRPLLILCPGAEYGPAKCWPLEYYAIVAKRKIAQGWQVWVLGSEKDASIGARVAALAGEACVNLGGQTTLAEAVDLMSLAHAVVTNDSGLMHVAAALDKPLIALYGSSSPRQTPPLNKNADLLYLRLSCSPCFKRVCPLKHCRCLREIRPEQVLEKLKFIG